MRYIPVKLLTRVVVDVDELGNDIYDLVSVGNVKGRATEWSTRDVNLFGRDFTERNRKLLIRPPRVSIEGIKYVRFDDITYEVNRTVDLNRWILFIVGRYR